MTDLTSPAFTYTFFLILIRVSGMLVSAPLLSHKGIPSWTKVGFAVFFALVLVPLQQDSLAQPPTQLAQVVSAVGSEVVFGLALGMAMNLVFIGLSLASRILGLQMGFNIGAVADPITGAEFGTFDQFYTLLVTLVFFSINGHYIIIQSLSDTLKGVPLGTFDPFTIQLSALTPLVAGLTLTAVRIAMPVMAALFLTDLGLGMVARTVPQMQIMVVGAPVKILIGVVVMAAALPATMALMNGVINSQLAGTSQQLLGAR
ncbi:MAG: flagellar biosynthetic protein FliR [Tepidiformaceae bacterium]